MRTFEFKGLDVRFIPLLLLAVAGMSCSPQADGPVGGGRGESKTSGQLTTPQAARVNVDDTLSKFDLDASAVLLRYLAGNERWEVREEGGKKYAVRREFIGGRLETTFGGYYATELDGQVRQTRVLISFGGEYGFGIERGNVTRTNPSAIDVPIVLESEHVGSPGNSSYLIVHGPTVNLEIYDQAPTAERAFTKRALKEVGKELTAVLAHRDAIKATGVMPNPDFYPRPLPKRPKFTVRDGFQTGIYQLSAFVNPTTAGYVETRVLRTSTGKQILAEQKESRRYVGWSPDGSRYFPYNAEVIIYDGGGWSSTYKARFELWHTSLDGTQTMLGEKTRTISDWER